MNTAVPKKVRSPFGGQNKTSNLSSNATLPYADRKVTNALNAINSPGRGGRTKFEEMKTFETHERRNNGLRESVMNSCSSYTARRLKKNGGAIVVRRKFNGCGADAEFVKGPILSAKVPRTKLEMDENVQSP